MSRSTWKIVAVVLVAMPSVVLRLSGVAHGPLIAVAVFGTAVIAASILLAWATDVAQLDISASFATALLALVAILPEYAVDAYFAYSAGHRPEYGAYAAANMTGSNRLLIGVGWPLVALLFAIGRRRHGGTARAPTTARATVVLRPRRRVELAYLGVASIYALLIPFLRRLSVLDASFLLVLFAAYLWRTARQDQEEPELQGVAADIGTLGKARRRLLVVGFFALAAVLIAIGAKPFADGLVDGGRALGIDEFLLVQWLAPLSSEAPELIVAGLLAFRGKDESALGTLLSSKVNQWTLLVGSLPLAHAAGGGGLSLPLDARQNEEFILTAAQAIFAVSLLLPLRFRARDAALLFVTFAAQFVVPDEHGRRILAVVYGAAAVGCLVVRRRTLVPTLRALWRTPTEEEAPP